jgi:hypothetical protein
VANFFKNSTQLSEWIRDKENLGDAFNELLKVVKINSEIDFMDDELDIKDAVTAIYNDDDKDASKILHKILSRHNLTEASLNKGVYMKKEAQSKQRNDWMRGERNKWNRAVDGHKERTPWRVDRDQFYDFTHYAPDAISFDANPDNVYSGEALWRMYVMDKFYREYKTEDGKWVGGYVNDRFHVFPDAGTPANPDVDRMHGNQMQLGLNERTRKPRPHQYSTERMLEEARGNETYDLEVTTTAGSFNKLVKTASKVPVDRRNDVVYNVFTDCIEMKEAGVNYRNMLELVSDHYDIEVTHVAQIAKFAEKMIKKHDQIAYAFTVQKKIKTANQIGTFRVLQDLAGQTIDPNSGTQVPINILQGTVLVQTQPGTYQISSGTGMGQEIGLLNEGGNIQDLLESLDGVDDNIQEAADELGLNEVGEDLAEEPAEDIQEVDDTGTFEITQL